MLALLQRGASVNSRNEDGWTVVYHACCAPEPGVLAAVGLLLRCGADKTAVEIDGYTISNMLGLNGRTASEVKITNIRLLLARLETGRGVGEAG